MHTPGPWYLWDESQVGFKPTIVNEAAHSHRPDNQKYICDVRGPGKEWKTPSEETAANARLIAAAPDLLEACKSVVTTLMVMQMPRLDRNVASDKQLAAIAEQTLRAAIAKAERSGESE